MTSHLKAYLDYYSTLKAPGFAVLVTGAWGVGKTYQVKANLSTAQHYYVSLFGLKTTEEVHAAVIAAIAPNLERLRKGVREVGYAAEKLGGWFSLGGSVSGLINALVRRQIIPDRILVFDDLERCGLELTESMGIISNYLDQHGFGVVVIAHDDELGDQFAEVKERIFGQTIKTEPEVEKALDHFLSNIADHGASGFIGRHRELAVQVFLDSGASSLRVLRHLIDDLGRLYAAMETDHLGNPDAVSELLGLFCALDIEVRIGNLKRDDLRNRVNERMRYDIRRRAEQNEEGQLPPFLSAADKHPSINLESQILTDNVLTAMLIDGRYDAEAIRDSINNSLFFSDPGEAPPWKTVFHFDELDDSVVDAASARMHDQFENREITESGEMLHVFSLRLMMSQNGLINESLEEVRDQCISYIDDLLNNGQLPARGLDWRWYDGFERGYDGYGYWVTQEAQPYFSSLWDHLIAAREAALERKFPEITEVLLQLVENDGQRFYEQVCQTNNGENPYAMIPILAAISPNDFVSAWLGGHYSNWRWIALALKERFDSGRLQQELAKEVDWAVEVLQLLEKERDKADGFRSLRIERTIPDTLRQIVEDKDDEDKGGHHEVVPE